MRLNTRCKCVRPGSLVLCNRQQHCDAAIIARAASAVSQPEASCRPTWPRCPPVARPPCLPRTWCHPIQAGGGCSQACRSCPARQAVGSRIRQEPPIHGSQRPQQGSQPLQYPIMRNAKQTDVQQVRDPRSETYLFGICCRGCLGLLAANARAGLMPGWVACKHDIRVGYSQMCQRHHTLLM